MKAWLNAPSATNRLNKLGIFNITTNTSCATPAPKMYVVAISLRTPNILEINVQNETTIVFREVLVF